MRKRFLGIFLSFAIALSQLPIAALAETTPAGDSGPESGKIPVVGLSSTSGGCTCTQLCAEDSADSTCPVCSAGGYFACLFTQAPNAALLNSIPTAQSILEDIEISIDGLTYTFDLDADAMTACLTDIAEPEAETPAAVPSTFEYDGTTYTVTELSWGFFSSKRNNITALTLPDTLTDVGSTSFGKFPKLTEITIPGSVKSFGGNFQGMKNLHTLTFGEGVEEISSNMMVSGCSALTAIQLPDSLKTISGPGAFSDAESLTDITLPEGIAITEGSLFSDCTALVEIRLPASVTEIQSSMFEGCTSLKKVTADGAITAIGPKAFSGAENLTEIPDLSLLTEIESYVFQGCKSLTGPLDLSHVTKVGFYAFDSCYRLTGELDLTGLTEIPNYAFRFVGYWGDDITLKFGPNLESIGNQAFSYAPIRSLELPESLTKIGNSVFNQCVSLTGTVSIPDSVTSIGTGAFSGTNVEVFEIGSGLTDIPANALSSSSLQKIIVNNSADAVTGLPNDGTVEIVYLIASIEDNVGDTISDDPSALSLQAAVDSAAQTGETVVLGKNIKLSAPVTVPAGQPVVICPVPDEEYWIMAVKSGLSEPLFIVEEGASVEFIGNLVLSGRYNSGSIVDNQGSVTLSDGVLVRDGKISSLFGGVIKTHGENAEFTLDGGIVKENQISGDSGGVVSVSDGARFLMKDGNIEDNKVGGDCDYSATVRISGGATFEMSGGAIQDNNASGAEPLNSTAGLLLYGNAGGVMSGGNISGNTGHRGSAVLVWGYDDDNRTTFAMTNGTISDNTSSKKGNIDPSGAVHVENNAKFTMTGGNIIGNDASSAGVGGGVCVVDGAIQQQRPEGEYRTAFIMNGGTISNNKASYGGGIYSYSNAVELNAGLITDNTAFEHGGGVYGEGREPYYSTFSIANALVTDNTAQQGGGMMLCATGSADVYVTKGIAVFGNLAQDDPILGPAAGDDFAFTASSFGTKEGIVTLPDRILGGGAALWYQDGGVLQPATGVYPNTDENAPRFGEAGADPKPVTVKASQRNLALKTVVSENAQKLARQEAKLIITGNTARRGGGIGANGGMIIGDPVTTKVTISKTWAGDTAADRPASIAVELLNGGTVIDTVELTASDGWTHTFTGLPTTDGDGSAYSYTVSEVSVGGYTTEITGNAEAGFTITNTKPGLPGPDPSYIDVTVKKSWVLDNGGVQPNSITVELRRNNSTYQTVELNQDNSWTYTWKALDDQYDWKVVETDVPDGFTATVKQLGNAFFITNDDIATSPGGPDDPDKPDPDDPDKPDPDDPDKPDPDNPDKPDPDDPDKPDPDNPDKPDPDDPDKPVDSDDSDTPVDFDDPEPPVEPGEPSAPVDPNDTEHPDKPDEEVLPQTGRLWRPIWLMALAGVALVLAGMVGKTKRHRKNEK